MDDPTPARRLASTLLSILVAVLLLIVLMRGVDLPSLAQTAASLRPLPALLVLCAFVLNHALRIARWQALASQIPARINVRVCLAAFLAILVLPLRLGEIVRPAGLLRAGFPLEETLPLLAAERLLDLLALALLISSLAALLDLPSVVVQGVDVMTVARGGALTGALAVFALLAALLLAGDLLSRLPVAGVRLAASSLALRSLAASPRRASLVLLLTALTWLSCVLYVWAALAALPLLPAQLPVAAATWSGILSASITLPTPGMFGSYEAGAACVLALYGVPIPIASTWALLLHVSYLLFVAASALPSVWMRAQEER